MERINFLVDETGERVTCLLNPETVTMRRWSGIADLPAEMAPLSASTMSDTPVIFTGGGRTELDLELLFDIDLDPREGIDDVRDLTLPLWQMSENAVQAPHRVMAPKVWVLWGREWSFLSVIESIAERFENMDSSGAPHRSWMSLRARRVSDKTFPGDMPAAGVPASKPRRSSETAETVVTSGDGGTAGGFEGVRPDHVATQLSGDPRNWRSVCAENDIDNPMGIPAGTVLRRPEAPGTP